MKIVRGMQQFFSVQNNGHEGLVRKLYYCLTTLNFHGEVEFQVCNLELHQVSSLQLMQPAPIVSGPVNSVVVTVKESMILDDTIIGE